MPPWATFSNCMPQPTPITGVRGGGQAHQPAVEVLAVRLQNPHRGVKHVAVAAAVEIGPADEQQTVEHFQHSAKVLLVFHRRHQERNGAGLHQGVQ